MIAYAMIVAGLALAALIAYVFYEWGFRTAHKRAVVGMLTQAKARGVDPEWVKWWQEELERQGVTVRFNESGMVWVSGCP